MFVPASPRFAVAWHEHVYATARRAGFLRPLARTCVRQGGNPYGASTFPAMPIASEVMKFSSTEAWLPPLWLV